jgi:hypothetical protein
MREACRIADSTLHSAETLYWFASCFRIEGADLRCCVVWLRVCYPMFRRNVPPSASGLWVRWTHNPEDESGTCLGKAGKILSQDTVQQPTGPGWSVVTQWQPQIAVFLLLTMYIISGYFNFIVDCVVFMHDWLERYKFLYLGISLHEHKIMLINSFFNEKNVKYLIRMQEE